MTYLERAARIRELARELADLSDQELDDLTDQLAGADALDRVFEALLQHGCDDWGEDYEPDDVDEEHIQ